jgi:predicted transcriptional regulator
MPTTSVRIDQDLEQRLKTLAKTTGRTKAWYIRQALEAYLAQEEWMVQAINEGIKATDEGRTVDHDQVEAWLDSWGTENELERPQCD